MREGRRGEGEVEMGKRKEEREKKIKPSGGGGEGMVWKIKAGRDGRWVEGRRGEE